MDPDPGRLGVAELQEGLKRFGRKRYGAEHELQRLMGRFPIPRVSWRRTLPEGDHLFRRQGGDFVVGEAIVGEHLGGLLAY